MLYYICETLLTSATARRPSYQTKQGRSSKSPECVFGMVLDSKPVNEFCHGAVGYPARRLDVVFIKVFVYDVLCVYVRLIILHSLRMVGPSWPFIFGPPVEKLWGQRAQWETPVRHYLLQTKYNWHWGKTIIFTTHPPIKLPNLMFNLSPAISTKATVHTYFYKPLSAFHSLLWRGADAIFLLSGL